MGEGGDGLPAALGFISEDDDAGVLGPVGVDGWIWFVGAEFAAQQFDVGFLAGEKKPSWLNVLM